MTDEELFIDEYAEPEYEEAGEVEFEEQLPRKPRRVIGLVRRRREAPPQTPIIAPRVIQSPSGYIANEMFPQRTSFHQSIQQQAREQAQMDILRQQEIDRYNRQMMMRQKPKSTIYQTCMEVAYEHAVGDRSADVVNLNGVLFKRPGMKFSAIPKSLTNGSQINLRPNLHEGRNTIQAFNETISKVRPKVVKKKKAILGFN